MLTKEQMQERIAKRVAQELTDNGSTYKSSYPYS